MMAKLRKLIVFIFPATLAIVPILNQTLGGSMQWLSTGAVAGLNFVGWSLFIYLVFMRTDLERFVSKIAHQLGLSTRFQSVEEALRGLVREVERKNSALSMNVLERRITSEEEQSEALERVAASAFKLLRAESAELALFDTETGLYHTSFVMGMPFRTSAQAMLSGAADGERGNEEISADVLVQPIAFAGSVLGSLRVALKRGSLPTQGDREIMRLLALQGGLAIINAEYTQQLVRMKESSEESVKAKTGFLANLSHEIRGPLGIMLNAVEVVIDGLCGEINDDQLDTLKMVRRNGEHLLELISDVLDYAKVESGKINPNKADIVVNELLKDITKVVRSQAEGKGHKVHYKASDDMLAISCDRRHIRQIMINLLTNAIKYTPAGGKIEVWAERVPGNKVKVFVKDNGIGIEASDHHCVFSAFERVENSYSMTQMGTGLGMPLTKRLAEVNGGDVDFESSSGEGSTFWIVFPAIKVVAPALGAEKKVIEDAKGNGNEILLVETEEGERDVMSRYLTHLGFKVIPVGTQLEALEALRENRVELAMIDNRVVDSPNENENVINAIRSETEQKFPIILVSSRAFVFDIEKYLKAGIDLCLTKPLELKELGHICRGLIDNTYSPDPASNNLTKIDSAQSKKGQPAVSRAIKIDDILH